MIKQCSKCKKDLELNLDNFGIDHYNTNGFNSQCRNCRKLYYKNNKSEILKRTSLYQKNNPSVYLKSSAAYRKRNLEKCRDKDRKFHANRRNKDRINAITWRHKNPDKVKIYNQRSMQSGSHLKSRYGISLIRFEEILEEQNYLCSVCYEPFNYTHRATKPHIDHDHKTGKVRGILHMRCNTMLGHAKDNPEILENGARYLRNHANIN